MQRMQITLDDDRARRLRQASAARGISMAEMVRRAIDQLDPDDERWARALEVVGRFHSGRSDISREHDREFADSIHDW